METSLTDKIMTRSGRFITAHCMAIMLVLSLWLAPEDSGALSWYNLLMPSIIMLYLAAFLMTVFVFIFIKLVGGMSGFKLSIGMLANQPVAMFRTFIIYVGLLPFADSGLPVSILNRKGAYWSVTALPSILMILIGLLIMGICREYATELTTVSPLFNISQCSLLALFSQACIINGVVYEVMQIDHLKDVFPSKVWVYSFSQGFIVIAFLSFSRDFLTFFKEFVLGIAPM